MRGEALYLQDMADAANEVFEFVAGLDYDAFLANKAIRKAVLCDLVIIGEAASHVPESSRARYPGIDWSGVISFRHYAVHHYFGIRWRDVWESASQELPALSQQVAHILEDEFPEEESEDSQA
jgi:uncharacterized protein with HEPN domain